MWAIRQFWLGAGTAREGFLPAEYWSRTHNANAAITLSVVEAPLRGWMVGAGRWRLPRHFTRLHATREAAQRAADDVIRAYVPHDCRHCSCGEWRLVGIGTTVSEDSDGMISHRALPFSRPVSITCDRTLDAASSSPRRARRR